MDASIRLLRTSYEKLLNRKELFWERFFNELLGTMPHLRKLYTHTDSELMPRFFLPALGTLVSLAEERDNLARFARSIGARHVRYGVSALDMSAAVPLLLHAMRDVLGPSQGWTAECQAAWADLLWTAISAMCEGAFAAEQEACLWDE